jgi:hypothetical protein
VKIRLKNVNSIFYRIDMLTNFEDLFRVQALDANGNIDPYGYNNLLYRQRADAVVVTFSDLFIRSSPDDLIHGLNFDFQPTTYYGFSESVHQNPLRVTWSSRCLRGYGEDGFNSGCVECASGKYAPYSMPPKPCKSCPAGTVISSATRATGCIACFPGKFKLREIDDTITYDNVALLCSNCTSGSYSTTVDAQACTSCTPGKYSDQAGSTECFFCPGGKYSHTYHMASCSECPAGQQAQAFALDSGQIGGATSCVACNPGFFKANSSDAYCTACDQASYQDEFGATACKVCTPGTYLHPENDLNRGFCDLCEEGKYAPQNSSTSCIQCAAGTFQDEKGKAACKGCPAGTFSTVVGATSMAVCSQCAAATYSAQAGATSCSSCPEYSYAESFAGSSSCILCPAGKFFDLLLWPWPEDRVGPWVCKACSAGHYSTEGQPSCYFCPVGTIAPETGSPSCRPCDAGYTSNYDRSDRSPFFCITCFFNGPDIIKLFCKQDFLPRMCRE